VPVLSFLLKFHKDHFSLTPVVSINSNPLKFAYKPHLFVFEEITNIYLMPSVEDDEFLFWIYYANNKKLTILKHHFAEFHKAFLYKVSTYYEVLFIDPKFKKAVPYSFNVISNEINN
jgi:hypothetical protein